MELVFGSNTFIMISLILSMILFLNPLSDSITSRQEKKIIKIAHKVWEERPLQIEELNLTDEKGQRINGYYFKVSSHGQLIGFMAGERILDNYLNYFPVLLMDSSYTIIRATILEMNTIRGAEITSRAWLKQFSGYTGEPIRYGKEINAITGATLSGLSMVKEVQQMRLNIKGALLTRTGTILGQ